MTHKTSCTPRFFPYVPPCPNRTCLWSCVGRRQSRTRGRRTVVEKTGSRRRTGEPRLCGGSRLKATTDRAFLVSVGPPKADLPKRLVFLAGRADGIPPFQTMATLIPRRNPPPGIIVSNGAAPDRSLVPAGRCGRHGHGWRVNSLGFASPSRGPCRASRGLCRKSTRFMPQR